MKITFALAIITIMIGIIIYYCNFRKLRNLKKNIFIALFTGVIAMTFLVYPLQIEYNNFFTRLLASFFYAMKCAGMGEDLKILSRINLDSTSGYIYFSLMNFMFVLMPVITVGFILTFLEDIYISICLKLMGNKELHIFSDVNEKSLLIARKIQNSQNAKIIFTNVIDKSNLDIKTMCIKEKITSILFDKNYKAITFYLISENEEENLHMALELIEKYRNKDNIKINLLNSAEETVAVIDSTDKGKVSVEIINEKERAVFNLLNNTPLFLNCINKTISILIVGCGKLGKEFLKDATWCAMMNGYNFKALVIDKNANNIKENIEIEAPDFLCNYDIKFLNADIKSHNAISSIKSQNDINYVLVATESDEKNLNISIMLRRFFIREFQSEPVINLWISNSYKQKQISSIVNEKNNEYKLNAFGSVEELYLNNSIMNSELEKKAIQIHLSYNPDDIDLKKYNLLEYNKRSSRASALHIKYKIFSVLEDLYSDDMNKNYKLFKEKYSKEIEDMLTKNEHDRWSAYMRSIGYVGASIEEVKAYYKKTNNHINYLARIHPALVEFDELDKISQEISKISKREIDLKDSDRQIVKNIYEKVIL